MYPALRWTLFVRAIMESAERVPIVQAACKAGIVIGFIRSGTEPFAMIVIVPGNS